MPSRISVQFKGCVQSAFTKFTGVVARTYPYTALRPYKLPYGTGARFLQLNCFESRFIPLFKLAQCEGRSWKLPQLEFDAGVGYFQLCWFIMVYFFSSPKRTFLSFSVLFFLSVPFLSFSVLSFTYTPTNWFYSYRGAEKILSWNCDWILFWTGEWNKIRCFQQNTVVDLFGGNNDP